MADTGGPEDPEIARLREQLAAAERAAELRADLQAAQEEFRAVEDEIYADAREAEDEQHRQQKLERLAAQAEAEAKAERLRRQTSERLREEAWLKQIEAERRKLQKLREYQQRRSDFLSSPKGRFTISLVVLIFIAALGAGVLLSRPDTSNRPDRWTPATEPSSDRCVAVRDNDSVRSADCEDNSSRQVVKFFDINSVTECPPGTETVVARNLMQIYCLVMGSGTWSPDY